MGATIGGRQVLAIVWVQNGGCFGVLGMEFLSFSVHRVEVHYSILKWGSFHYFGWCFGLGGSHLVGGIVVELLIGEFCWVVIQVDQPLLGLGGFLLVLVTLVMIWLVSSCFGYGLSFIWWGHCCWQFSRVVIHFSVYFLVSSPWCLVLVHWLRVYGPGKSTLWGVLIFYFGVSGQVSRRCVRHWWFSLAWELIGLGFIICG